MIHVNGSIWTQILHFKCIGIWLQLITRLWQVVFASISYMQKFNWYEYNAIENDEFLDHAYGT